VVRLHSAGPCPCSSTDGAPGYEPGGCEFDSRRGYATGCGGAGAPGWGPGGRRFDTCPSRPTGCGAAWSARLLREQEAAGSNPAKPTTEGGAQRWATGLENQAGVVPEGSTPSPSAALDGLFTCDLNVRNDLVRPTTTSVPDFSTQSSKLLAHLSQRGGSCGIKRCIGCHPSSVGKDHTVALERRVLQRERLPHITGQPAGENGPAIVPSRCRKEDLGILDRGPMRANRRGAKRHLGVDQLSRHETFRAFKLIALTAPFEQSRPDNRCKGSDEYTNEGEQAGRNSRSHTAHPPRAGSSVVERPPLKRKVRGFDPHSAYQSPGSSTDRAAAF
jgi:hypothetical protein